MDKPPKFRPTKKKMIALIAVTLFLVAVMLPVLWPDASWKYEGVKKEAAHAAVNRAWQGLSGINYFTSTGTIKISVDDVKVGGANDANWCQGDFISGEDFSEGNDFLVKVTYRTIFGIPLNEVTYHICRQSAGS